MTTRADSSQAEFVLADTMAPSSGQLGLGGNGLNDNDLNSHGLNGSGLNATAESGHSDLNSLAQAAEWFAILRDDSVSPADHAQWQSWLAVHAEHRAAWAEVQAVNSPFTQLGRVGDSHAAKAALTSSARKSALLTRRHALKLLGLGGIALFTGVLLKRHSPWRDWVTNVAARSDSYSTAVGSTQRLTLAEGSQLWLNTGSRADVAYSMVLRRITLHSGELLLQSAPDSQQPARPLVVDTEHGRLTALGTRFTVKLQGDSTLVAVYDGAVAITPMHGSSGFVLNAGQQTRFTAQQISPPQAADQARASWTRGILLADNRRLDDFIAELATYRQGKLSVAPEAAGLRLMGAYPLRDTERVLMAISETLPVRLRHHGADEVELVRR